MGNIYPKNYQSKLSLIETQEAIDLIKVCFTKKLAQSLLLKRVSAPVFVDPSTGLNDNLNGFEKAVSFDIEGGKTLEIVQSLAKWKRYALKQYNLSGLFTDMNAIRKHEKLDNLHSIYVDQWDWEKVINEDERQLDYLKMTVEKIYKCLIETQKYIQGIYPVLKSKLPENITFITSEELLRMYPLCSSKEREYQITKKYGSVFIIGIGQNLSNNEPHDLRAFDYDDWNLNGDLLVYDSILDVALELSSMGIRVNHESLLEQMKVKNNEQITPYHQAVLNNELPLTIGGGIGQSRLSMFLLEKAHIGEVQSSYWKKEDKEELKKHNIVLL